MLDILNLPAIIPKQATVTLRSKDSSQDKEIVIEVIFYEKNDRTDNNFSSGYIGTNYRVLIAEKTMKFFNYEPRVNDVLQIEGKTYKIINKPRLFNYSPIYNSFYQMEVKSTY